MVDEATVKVGLLLKLRTSVLRRMVLYKAAAVELAKHTATLTSIIVNGAVSLGVGGIEDLKSSDLLKSLDTNVVGPHNVIRAFNPFLLASKDTKRTLAVVSSVLGSITNAPAISTMSKDLLKLDHLVMGAYSVSKSVEVRGDCVLLTG